MESGRIHIPMRQRFAAFCREVAALIPMALITVAATMLAMGISCEVRGADIPRALFDANSGAYKTRLFAVNSSANAASFTFNEIAPTSNCYNVTLSNPIAPHRAAVYQGDEVCDGVALIIAPSDLSVRSLISFDNGTDQSSFVVPAVGAVTITAPVVVGPVISDDQMSAYVTGFATEKTALSVEVFGGDPAFGAQPRGDVETIEANAGAFQYKVKAQGVLWMRLTLGFIQFGLTPSTKPVYGFVSNATARNSNSIVIPF